MVGAQAEVDKICARFMPLMANKRKNYAALQRLNKKATVVPFTGNRPTTGKFRNVQSRYKQAAEKATQEGQDQRDKKVKHNRV